MDYRLRVTPWARGISLRVTATGALEVVARRRHSPRTIARILTSEAAWIQAAQAEVATRRQALQPQPTWRLPPEIHCSITPPCRLPSSRSFFTRAVTPCA